MGGFVGKLGCGVLRGEVVCDVLSWDVFRGMFVREMLLPLDVFRLRGMCCSWDVLSVGCFVRRDVLFGGMFCSAGCFVWL